MCSPSCASGNDQSNYPGRHLWAMLLRHVFAANVTTCAHCEGRMRVRMLCTTADAIAAAMTRAAVKARAPPPTTCGFRFSYGFPSRSPGSPKSYARACSHGRYPVRPVADDPRNRAELAVGV